MRLLPTLLALLVPFTPGLRADDGITDGEIRIGQAAALQGSAAELGTGVNAGLNAALAEANAKGGVAGRRLRLIALDDGYEPAKCQDVTLRLIEEEKVFCLAGYVGTPTAKNAMGVIGEYGIPTIGLYTGAGALRKPVQRHLFNIRASYDEESELIVERLTKDLGAKRIAMFFQNDAFGRAGLSGTEAALKRRGLSLAASGSYERGTTEVAAGLATVSAAKPDAVVVFGTARPVAALVKATKAAKFDAPLVVSSFVGTEALIGLLGSDADGVAISQVVPSPEDPSVPLVKDYQAALAAYDANLRPSYVSLEGYLYGRVLIAGLERAGRDLTRAKLEETLENFRGTNLGGLTIDLGKDDHQALDTVWLTQVRAGRALPITAFAKPASAASAAPATPAKPAATLAAP